MKKLLLIDNYDSFTYNLVQYFQSLGVEVLVRLNDAISLEEAKTLSPDFLVFSPGPGTVDNPQDVGIGPDFFAFFQGKIPILGVCLGHQMMGKIFGGKIQKIKPQHGKRWPIRVLDKSGLFRGFSDSFEGMRYHSMVIQKQSFLQENFKITAETDDSDQEIMAIEDLENKIFGVQFHPESIGTKVGIKILENFIAFGA